MANDARTPAMIPSLPEDPVQTHATDAFNREFGDLIDGMKQRQQRQEPEPELPGIFPEPPVLQATKHDGAKLRFDLVPPEVEIALAAALTYGARKYSVRNWEQGFDWGRCYAALRRHLTSWQSGEQLDPRTGIPHLWTALASLSFLVAFESRKHGNDDRAAQPGEARMTMDEAQVVVMRALAKLEGGQS